MAQDKLRVVISTFLPTTEILQSLPSFRMTGGRNRDRHVACAPRDDSEIWHFDFWFLPFSKGETSFIFSKKRIRPLLLVKGD
jgi:hypothetical protein